jgi:hypothetical protein
MSWGKSRQEVPKTPPRAATTVVEEAVVEEAPEGYAAEIEKKKELLDYRERAQVPGAGASVGYETRRKLDAVPVGPNRPALPSGPSPLPFGAGKMVSGPGPFGMLDDRRPVEPESAESILTLPAYPKEPSGEASATPDDPWSAYDEDQGRAAETAAEVYLRRLNRPVDDVLIRGDEGYFDSREEHRDYLAREAKSLGLMDFGTLNKTYDHMSIPLLTEYADQLRAREAELKELIAAEVGAGTIEGQPAGKVYKGQKEADKGLPYAQHHKPDILNWIQRSLLQAEDTKAQMVRIRDALEAEAKSDKK